MTLQKAVVHGTIADVVQFRNIYAAEVTLGNVYSYEDMWTLYLGPIYNAIRSILSNVVETQYYEILIPDAGHWVPFQQVTFVKVGAEGTDYLPNAVAAVLLALAPGFRHVGRKFFSGIAETHTTNNSLTSTGLSYAVTALAAYLAPVGVGDGSVLNPGIIDKTGTFHQFTSGVVASLLGSQRRRKPGLGI